MSVLGKPSRKSTCGFVTTTAYESLKAENDKLRAERDEWHRVAVSKQDIIDHMRDAKAENAELRELVLKNWYIALSEREALRAYGIDSDGSNYVAVLDTAIATAKDCMREFGIVVDDD